MNEVLAHERTRARASSLLASLSRSRALATSAGPLELLPLPFLPPCDDTGRSGVIKAAPDASVAAAGVASFGLAGMAAGVAASAIAATVGRGTAAGVAAAAENGPLNATCC